MNPRFSSLERYGWIVQGRASTLPPQVLPPAPLSRLDRVPDSLVAFLSEIDACYSHDEKVWLLTHQDYLKTGDDFAWDFIETKLSLASAEGDSEWESEIRAFWKDRLPIAFNCRGDYSYLALRRTGVVEIGTAPELEESTVLVASYDAFWDLASGQVAPSGAQEKLFLEHWLQR